MARTLIQKYNHRPVNPMEPSGLPDVEVTLKHHSVTVIVWSELSKIGIVGGTNSRQPHVANLEKLIEILRSVPTMCLHDLILNLCLCLQFHMGDVSDSSQLNMKRVMIDVTDAKTRPIESLMQFDGHNVVDSQSTRWLQELTRRWARITMMLQQTC